MGEVGLFGSARIEGVGHLPGAGMNEGGANPAVKRAMIFWVVAFGVLIVFHVGGSNVG